MTSEGVDLNSSLSYCFVTGQNDESLSPRQLKPFFVGRVRSEVI
jgi:hypothetical protein